MRTLGAVCLWLALVSPAQALTNQLGSHPSPYLALHGDDPVAWQVWSESVFEKARQETNWFMSRWVTSHATGAT